MYYCQKSRDLQIHLSNKSAHSAHHMQTCSTTKYIGNVELYSDQHNIISSTTTLTLQPINIPIVESKRLPMQMASLADVCLGGLYLPSSFSRANNDQLRQTSADHAIQQGKQNFLFLFCYKLLKFKQVPILKS